MDADFREQIMITWVKREKGQQLEGADGLLRKRSGIVQVQNVQMEVLDARLGHDKTLDLVAEVACLEPGCRLILGFHWITAYWKKLKVTRPNGLELNCTFEIEEGTDFSEFGEILERSQYVARMHVRELDTRRRADGTMRRVMKITAAEDLDPLASHLPAL